MSDCDDAADGGHAADDNYEAFDWVVPCWMMIVITTTVVVIMLMIMITNMIKINITIKISLDLLLPMKRHRCWSTHLHAAWEQFLDGMTS